MVAIPRQSKILDFECLTQLRLKYSQKKIVHCHGVFDVLHAGHLAYFESAKKFGDILIVTITADKFVNKGPGRPYFTDSIRASMLAALEIVDYVAINNSSNAVTIIDALKANFYVKGPDYRDKTTDPTGAIYLEEKAVERHGGNLVFTNDETYSSSSLINTYFPVWNEEQQTAIAEIKHVGGLEIVEEVLERVSKLKVVVIGEPIVDTYVFCKPEAISSKSPSISARYLYEENYAGGSLAIANHLSDFVSKVTLLTTHGGEPYFKYILDSKIDPRVEIIAEILPNFPTPKKTRFIADDKVQRLFELTDIRPEIWLRHSPDKFCQLMKQQMEATDCTIAADFGHGLFEDKILSALSENKGFLALNVQTNSSNLGFNPFTKHSHFSYLSIDLKEARIAFQDRFSSNIDLARKLKTQLSPREVSFAMTLGPNGSYFYPAGKSQEIKIPAFADTVVDALGAGDAFFSLSSLLVKVNCPSILIPFLGNIFAGLKTKIIGNKSAVSQAQLIKAVTAILK